MSLGIVPEKAQRVFSLTTQCGAKDKARAGHFILCGVTLPIWSPAEVVKYMTTAQMQAVIEDMERYLGT
jgi:hypothetical protein